MRCKPRQTKQGNWLLVYKDSNFGATTDMNLWFDAIPRFANCALRFNRLMIGSVAGADLTTAVFPRLSLSYTMGSFIGTDLFPLMEAKVLTCRSYMTGVSFDGGYIPTCFPYAPPEVEPLTGIKQGEEYVRLFFEPALAGAFNDHINITLEIEMVFLDKLFNVPSPLSSQHVIIDEPLLRKILLRN